MTIVSGKPIPDKMICYVDRVNDRSTDQPATAPFVIVCDQSSSSYADREKFMTDRERLLARAETVTATSLSSELIESRYANPIENAAKLEKPSRKPTT